MRIVADTNVLVSALLWTGLPHHLLIAAEAGRITLYTSLPLIDELHGVLSRQKFAARLVARQVMLEEVIAGYIRLAHLVLPAPLPPIILDDPDDDAVLACAVAAEASYIVSGDVHLVRLKRYGSIHIVPPGCFVRDVLRIPH